ncbi:MAG: acyltransferase family protein [Actinomycetaceae bacterium]|nr:acyltransferase family protein [Actinomycetaceae bacterium]
MPQTLAEGVAPPDVKPVPAPKRFRLGGLDGVRALAALAVVAYHLIPGFMPGGFLGVDVFFVLSGFLITGLLIRERRRSGRIDVKAFWKRRFRRLFPAVALTVLITVPLGIFAGHDTLLGIRRQVIGSLTFTANWLEVWAGQSYFDRGNPRLLTNMWSLALEQQFYLFWPLVLLLAFKLKSSARWTVPFVLAAVSVAAMYFLQDPLNLTRVYQGTDTRGFGLMLGAILAMFFPRALARATHALDPAVVRARGLAAWLSLIGVFAAMFVIPDTPGWTYPWGILMVCILTLGVMQAMLDEVSSVGGPGRALMLFLEWRPLVWLGERSYSLYLWHWPLNVLAQAAFPHAPIWVNALVVLTVSIAAAGISYTYVETPMRVNGIVGTMQQWSRALSKGNTNSAKRWMPLVALAFLVSMNSIALIAQPDKSEAELFIEKAQKEAAEIEGDHALTPTPPAIPPSGNQGGEGEAGETETPQPGQSAQALPSPTGDQVLIVGDSVTLAAQVALLEALPGTSIDAKVSRFDSGAVDIVRQWRDSGVLRPYLVFAAATNSKITATTVDKILEIIGPERRLVLVTGFGPTSKTWIEESNQAIRQYAAQHHDKVAVAEWALYISTHTDYLASDAVHPDGRGAQLFAYSVIEALGKLYNDSLTGSQK